MAYEGKHRMDALRAAENNSLRDERANYESLFAERFLGWLAPKGADEKNTHSVDPDPR